SEKSITVLRDQPAFIPQPSAVPAWSNERTYEKTLQRERERLGTWRSSSRGSASSSSFMAHWHQRASSSRPSSRRPQISGPTNFRHLQSESFQFAGTQGSPGTYMSPYIQERPMSFRPLELSIYAPENQLSPILPHLAGVNDLVSPPPPAHTSLGSKWDSSTATLTHERSYSSMSFHLPRKHLRQGSNMSQASQNSLTPPRQSSLNPPKIPPKSKARAYTAPSVDRIVERIASAILEKERLEAEIESVIERQSIYISSRPSTAYSVRNFEPMPSIPALPAAAPSFAERLSTEGRPRTAPSRISNNASPGDSRSGRSGENSLSSSPRQQFNDGTGGGGGSSSSNRPLAPPLPLVLRPPLRKKKSFSRVSSWLFPNIGSSSSNADDDQIQQQQQQHRRDISLDSITNKPKPVRGGEGFYQCVAPPRTSMDTLESASSSTWETRDEDDEDDEDDDDDDDEFSKTHTVPTTTWSPGSSPVIQNTPKHTPTIEQITEFAAAAASGSVLKVPGKAQPSQTHQTQTQTLCHCRTRVRGCSWRWPSSRCECVSNSHPILVGYNMTASPAPSPSPSPQYTRPHMYISGTAAITKVAARFGALRTLQRAAALAITEARCIREPGRGHKGNQPVVNASHSWGQYSPFFSVPSNISTHVPAGCALTFVQLLHRHGSRFPTANKSAAYNESITKIHDTVTHYGHDFAFIKDYQYTLGADQLTHFGQEELVDSGVSFYQRYKSLISASPKLPFIRASGQERVVMSAQNWTQGFHDALVAEDPSAGPNDDLPYDILVIPEADNVNNTLNNKQCPAFQKPPYSEVGEKAQEVYGERFTKPIIARLKKGLPGVEFSKPSHAVAFMDLCPFETVASPAGQPPSPFCGLFSAHEWAGYDYYQSLGKWYGYGRGNPLGPTLGVGWVNELIARLTGKHVVDHTSTNATLDGDAATFPLGRTLYADFSHDNDMTAMIAALGLYADTPPLSNTTRHPARDTGGFSASWTVPFASRIYVEKMTCGSGSAERDAADELVRVIVNDRMVPLTLCEPDDLGRCELGKFVKSLDFARHGGLWDLCTK
ncbi:histidine phosphatase superfamily, partial [Lasiosphaeria miniovina]